MKKTYIRIIVITISVFVIAVAVFYLVNKSVNKPIELVSENEKAALNLYHAGVYEVISRNASGSITAYRFIKLEEEKPINLELMTDAEKTEKGIPVNLKIQILQRDAQGKILSYRVIRKDSDIVTKY